MSGGRVLGYVRTERVPTWDELRMERRERDDDFVCGDEGCYARSLGVPVLHAFPDPAGGWQVHLMFAGREAEHVADEDAAKALCAFLLSAPATEEQEGEEG